MEQETISLEWNYNYILLCTMNCKKSRRSAISVAALDAPRELKATGPFWRVCFAVPVRRCFFSVRETPALIALFLLFSRCKTPHNPYSVVRMVTTNVLRIPLPGTPAATACWTISPRGWLLRPLGAASAAMVPAAAPGAGEAGGRGLFPGAPGTTRCPISPTAACPLTRRRTPATFWSLLREMGNSAAGRIFPPLSLFRIFSVLPIRKPQQGPFPPERLFGRLPRA